MAAHGPAIARCAMYGVLVFIAVQLLFAPLVGAGFFSGGDIALLLGSLAGNLVYGIVVAWIYHLPDGERWAGDPASAG